MILDREKEWSAAYLDEMLTNVGWLFSFVRYFDNKIDTKAFIKSFMNSTTADMLSQGNSRYVFKDTKELYDTVMQEWVTIPDGESWGELLPNWVGYIYMLFGHVYSVSSKRVLELLPLDFMESVYEELCLLEYRDAINVIAKKINNKEHLNIKKIVDETQRKSFNIKKKALKEYESAKALMGLSASDTFDVSERMMYITLTNVYEPYKDGAYKVPNFVDYIGSGAIIDLEKLTYLEVGSNVKEIGIGAIEGNKNLVKVKLNTGLEKIGAYAFAFNDSLASLEIPSTVRFIGENTMEGASSLTNLIIPNSVIRCEKQMLNDYNKSKVRNLDIPEKFKSNIKIREDKINKVNWT